MNTLTVRLSTAADAKARFVAAGNCALAGKAVEANPTLDFGSYDDMHRVLAPSRLTIVKALAEQGTLSIREVARRVGRDVQAVHRDVITLINAGVIDRTDKGVEFPYARIHFEFDVSAAA
ncbi:MAG: winged helix-turn-helix transcriptional regulator [Boseongicola sp.]|nr:winged helix-turn-helix transcriptional regulator [Boseongicola sp.]